MRPCGRQIAIACVIIASVAAAVQAADGGVAPRKPASQALVGIAAAVSPAIIGADGPELTQVEAAQRSLGLTGKGTTICVIDTGVDVNSQNFGKGCPHSDQCRIAFGFDVETHGDNPTPSDWENAGGHGTHVSGVALGGFPQKLLDADGKPLPFQRGVAFGAKLGAIRACTATSEFPYDFTRQALDKTVEKNCDVVNLSLGGFYVTPSKQLAPSVGSVLGADIIMTAAQGNDDSATQSGARMFNTASPGAFKDVLSIGHVNNTANPGAELLLDAAIRTPSGKRSTLYANQRADTQSSMCASPDCGGLKLPKEIILIKMAPRDGTGTDPKTVACDMDTITATRAARSKGQVLLLHVDSACKQFQNSPEIWELLETLRPVLVLIALPEEDDSHVGPMYYRNKQTPVLWLRAEDGHSLVAAITASPKAPISLKSLPGAALIFVPPDYSGQPAPTSALGPAFDLDMKPDVSAPGSLYSSLPNSTYQTWPGTSMAAPYMAGIVALWKESVLRQGVARPRAGWVAAANTAFKNTARPLPYRGSDKLMWPPVKVGAGVVQAHNAIINNVSIAPTELLVRTDVASQRFSLTVRNRGQADATYRLSHKPAVSVSLAHAWYGDGFDADLPTAHMLVVDKVITVPAGQTLTVDLKIEVPAALRATDTIYGGYLMLAPVQAPSSVSVAAVKAPRVRASGAAAEPPAKLVPLSVPYQGSSKDFSVVTGGDALMLFVPPLPKVDAESAKALSSKPSLFLCDVDGGKCNYTPGTITASPAANKGFRIASTLLRPVQDVKIQVWSANGKHLGTSASQGAGGTAPPLRRTYLTASGWDGSYVPAGSSSGKATAELEAGHTYLLKVELWPVLAAADRLAGRAPSQEPLVVQLDTLVTVPGAGAGQGAGPEDHVDARVSRKGRSKGKASKSSGDKHSSGGHRHSSGGGDKHSAGHRRSGSSGGSGDAGAALSAAGQQAQHIELDDAFDAAQLLYAHGRPSYVSLPL